MGTSILGNALATGLLGYLVGSINLSYLLGKLRGFDIRRSGSGNAGASNALITMGRYVGILAAVFDICKCVLVVTLAGYWFRTFRLAKVVAGVFCLLGHVFPFYMQFKGGKGLACIGGIILRYNWKVFLGMLFAELIVALVLDYICFVPITASLVFPMIYYHLERDLWGALLYGMLIPVVILRHRENLQRIRLGTEAHFSYLWKKNKEIDRMKEAYRKLRDEIGGGEHIKVILWDIEGTVLKNTGNRAIRFQKNAMEVINRLHGDVLQCAIFRGDEKAAEHLMRRSGLERMIDRTFVSDEMGFDKDDPDFYAAVHRLIGGVRPREILVVRDEPVFGTNAAEDHIRSCWVNRGESVRADASDYVIGDLEQLLPIIAQASEEATVRTL